MAEYLTDEQRIENIAACISWKKARALAVIYFGITQTKLDNYDEQDYNSGRYIDEWRKGDENRGKQELADILFDACDQYSSVGRREIKEHLGIKAPSGKPVLQPDSTVNSHLTESELGRLAMKITKGNLRQLATLLMGNEHDHLNNIEDEHKKDPFLAKFQIFVEWKKKHEADDERKKLARALYKAAKERSLFNIRDIKLILNVTKEQAFAEDAGDAAGDPAGNKRTEIESQTPASNLLSGTPRPGVAVAAAASGASAQNSTEGEPMTLVDFRSWRDPYSWLGMIKIRKDISDLVEKKGLSRPVGVAVVDSGVSDWSHYPTLPLPVYDPKSRQHLHTLDPTTNVFTEDFMYHQINLVNHTSHHDPNTPPKYNRNFIDAQNADFTLDVDGHGTFVAGIIAMNGPENVKIFNMKAMQNNIVKFEHLIAALKHVETLEEVDIINISLVFYSLDQQQIDELIEVLEKLSKKKIIIAAAGNAGATTLRPVAWPARAENIICVGGCDHHGERAGLSSKGVKILCPAKQVVSLNHTYGVTDYPGAEAPFCRDDGTSYGAPYACAIAGHVLAAVEAKLLQDGNSPEQAKAYRKKLVNTRVMRNILESMIQDGGMYPYENSFMNLDLLLHQCEIALTN